MQGLNTTNVKLILSNLQDYLKCKNLLELAEFLGVKRNTLYSWINRGVIGDTAAIIDKCRDVNLTYLQTGEGQMLVGNIKATLPAFEMKSEATNEVPGSEQPNFGPAPYPPKEPHSVPIISWVQAGDWQNAEDPFQPGQADEWLVTVETSSPSAFALIVRGDSMEPVFTEGEIITVDPDLEPRNSDYIIAKNGNEATFKQLVLDGSSVYLKPSNDRYPIKDMTGVDFVIVGVVVEKRKKFR